MLNKMGPRTEPCGTPLITSDQSDWWPFKTTFCFLPTRKFLIHSRTWLFIPQHCNLDIKQLCDTESKAFWKSKYNTSTTVTIIKCFSTFIDSQQKLSWAGSSRSKSILLKWYHIIILQVFLNIIFDDGFHDLTDRWSQAYRTIVTGKATVSLFKYRGYEGFFP